jgi:hypothetical protein
MSVEPADDVDPVPNELRSRAVPAGLHRRNSAPNNPRGCGRHAADVLRRPALLRACPENKQRCHDGFPDSSFSSHGRFTNLT